MRLWHKALIGVLPDMQLKGQWRECCLIAKALLQGNLNHVIVNRVKDYPTEHFYQYSRMVYDEMLKRGFKADKNKLLQYAILPEMQAFEDDISLDKDNTAYANLFDCYVNGKYMRWHNVIYLRQCLYNLEEKAIAGGIPYDEWEKIADRFGKYFDLWKK